MSGVIRGRVQGYIWSSQRVWSRGWGHWREWSRQMGSSEGGFKGVRQSEGVVKGVGHHEEWEGDLMKRSTTKDWFIPPPPVERKLTTHCADCSAPAMLEATSRPRHLCTAPNTVDQLRSFPPVARSPLSQRLSMSVQQASTSPLSVALMSSRR